jgi:hypothetical protein
VTAQTLEDAERILVSGGTSPTDFTLHDAEHAFRVAERMVDITPPDVFETLSLYELALLLQSAYLHDIGMTPQQSNEQAVHAFLATGDPSGLEALEQRALQRWLDDDEHGAAVPILSHAPSDAQLTLVDVLTAHYIRHRHNDWGVKWIRTQLKSASLGTYNDWLDDLVRLCSSHHSGSAELRTDQFNARPVGTEGAVVNLRYLACLLRVADVLEFDPERTPEVVFRHRNIATGSRLYWWKDHALTLVVRHDQVLLTARPPSAQIYRAVQDTLAQVDAELSLCAALEADLPFDHCAGLGRSSPHRWDLPSKATANILPLRAPKSTQV